MTVRATLPGLAALAGSWALLQAVLWQDRKRQAPAADRGHAICLLDPAQSFLCGCAWRNPARPCAPLLQACPELSGVLQSLRQAGQDSQRLSRPVCDLRGA